MINFNTNTNIVADNEVVINGYSFGKLNDEDTRKLVSIIKGFQTNYNSVSKPVTGLTFEDEQPKSTTKVIKKADDMTVTLEGKGNLVWFSCTANDTRTVVNGMLKDAGFVYNKDAERTDVYKVDYTGKDGVKHLKGEKKHGAWELKKGSKRDIAGASQWIGKEVTVSAEQREAVRNQWEQYKNRKRG